MSKVSAEIDIQFGDLPNTLNGVKTEFKELTKSIGDMVQGSEQYNATIKRLGELKGEIKDFKEAIKTLDPDERFKKFQGTLNGLVGGFAAITGAAALFGAESEDLQKTLVKVNGAIALLQGFQAFNDGVKDAKILINALTVATEAQTVALEGETVAADGAAVATTSFGNALKATGIGAIIGTIVFLIVYWDELTAALKGNYNAQSEVNKASKQYVEAAAKEQTAIGGLVAEYGRANTSASRRKDILFELNEKAPGYFGNLDKEADKVAALEKSYSKYSKALLIQAQIKGAQDLISKKSAELLEKENGELEDNLTFFQKIEAGAAQALGSATAAQSLSIYNATNNFDKLKKTTGEQVNSILKFIEPLQKQLADLGGDPDDDVHKKRLDDEKKKNEEALKATKDRYDKRIALEQDLQKKLADAQAVQTGNNATSTETKAIADAQASRDADLAKLKQYHRDKIITIVEYNQQVNNVQQIYNLQLLNINAVFLKSKAAEDKEAQKKASDDAVKASQDLYVKEQQALLQQLVDRQITQKQFDEQSLQNKITSDQALLASDSITAEARFSITKDLLDNELKAEQAANALRIQAINDNELQAKTVLDQQRGANLIDENTYQVALAQITLDKNQALLDDAKAKGDDTLKFEADVTEAKIALAQKERDAKTALLGDIGTALGQLSDLVGKQTAAGKALAVAQATIATIQSAVSSYNSLAGIPIVGPVLGGIAAAAAIATGYANVKKILAVPVPGQSGAGSAGAAPSTYSAPSVAAASNVTNLSGNSLGAINARTNTPIRAVVVESDITDAQGRVRGYESQGTI